MTGDSTPTRLLVVNAREDSVVVFLDLCARHTRLGAIQPHGQARLDLPPDLVVYPAGLRLHVYGARPGERLGSLRVPISGNPVPLVNIPAGPLPPDSSDTGYGTTDYSRFGNVVARPGATEGSVSVLSSNTPGVLIWSCRNDAPVLTLSTGGDIPDPEATALLAFGEEEMAEASGLPVVRSLTDGVVLPGAWAIRIMTLLEPHGPNLTIHVPEDRFVTMAHRFYGGLKSEHWSGLSCLRP